MIRKYIIVKGIVQGVGFRPFIYRIALKNNLKGWVKNSSQGVYIDIEGEIGEISNFLEELKTKAPILSKIEDITISNKELIGYVDFKILIDHVNVNKNKDNSNGVKESSSYKFKENNGYGFKENSRYKESWEYRDKQKDEYMDESENKIDEIVTLISPDVATCEECKNEVLDKNNLRRGKYPFVNCTNCGPRFTIIKKLPYDRFQTTMREFEMCDKCKSEYENPLDRRFHAEPTCCNKCGPKVTLLDNKAMVINCKDELEEVKKYLKQGKIIAVKGLGGFNLICNGKNEEVINTLRNRKRRKTKPLALMMRDIEIALKYCKINNKEKEILTGNKKPIVLLDKKNNFVEEDNFKDNKCSRHDLSNYLPTNIGFNSSKLGVLLPYTPLHYLLFDKELEVLVFTSANISGSPIIYKNNEALENLKDIADYFLIHNRNINMPIDDSVVNVVLNEERIIRSGRGYSPLSIKYLANSGILALGSQYKNTLSISNNNYIFTSPYIGDMDNIETLNLFEKNLNYYTSGQKGTSIYNINIKTVCYDMHPNYWSSEVINNYNCEKIGVYHHHAHIVSCMIDNGLSSEAIMCSNSTDMTDFMGNSGLIPEAIIGLAFDGAGYGEDGHIWGSEFLICDFKSFKRVGHLSYMDMVTGDGAVKYPWKMGVSLIYSSLKADKNSKYNKSSKDNKNTKEDGKDIEDRKDIESRNRILKEKTELEILNLIDMLPNKFSYKNISLIMKIIDNKINTPLTSSMGRLFDGVASLLGFEEKVSYEGEATIYLQNLAETFIRGISNNTEFKDSSTKIEDNSYKNSCKNSDENYYNYGLCEKDGMNIISANEIIKSILTDIKNGMNKEEIAMKFHNTIVEASLEICIKLRGKYKINTVALSGGVFQNEILLERLYMKLSKNNFKVLTHKTIPSNDSGVSIGQLVIANARIREKNK